MDPKLILDALLERSQQATAGGLDLAERKLGVENAEQRSAMLKGMGTGAAAAGALALLMGSKQGRKFSKKALKVGGAAAIGGLAWKAYSEWSAQQSLNRGASGPPGVTPAADLVAHVGTPIGELNDVDAQKRSEILIRAMIAAARIDGHIDAREKKLIEERLQSLGLEQDFSRLLIAEMAEPIDPARVAAFSDSPETAAEIYLASAMVVDTENSQGQDYLDSLATSLELNPNVRSLLDAPLRDT